MATEPLTRCALLTPAGRGALATVRVQGPQATAWIARHFQPAGSLSAGRLSLEATPLDAIRYGLWHGEDVVLGRVASDVWEIHCHGGELAPARIQQSLIADGCTPDDGWTLVRDEYSAWGAGLTPLAREARRLLVEAPTLRTATVLLDQFHGALDRELDRLDWLCGAGDFAAVTESLERLSVVGRAGCHLTRPFRVALFGRPNVGKSSLINRLVGYQRSIVLAQPGTTRDVVTATIAVQGWPCELRDTAGVQSTDDPLEAEGIARTRRAVESADLIVRIEDAAACLNRLDGRAGEPFGWSQMELPSAASGLPSLLVWNKADLIGASDIDRLPEPGWPVSALTGQGIDQLWRAMAAALVPVEPEPGEAVPFLETHAVLLNGALQAARSYDSVCLRRTIGQLRGEANSL
ncbi:MAG: GTPase [Pirellulales bacterium]